MDTGNNSMIKITNDFYIDKTKQLGKGNYGTVYKGFQLSRNQIIAIKFITRKILSRCANYQRQIMVMQDLAKINHPNIMGYYGYIDNQQGLYFFIEFCNGGSLKKIIKQTKLSQWKVLAFIKQIINAMTYINGQNKVHRDLKPQNILLDESGQLKIADFGLARDVQAKMTTGTGTPLYAAPQVLKSRQYNQKCDVWSAGLILYQMLTGKQLFHYVTKKPQLLHQINKFQTNSFQIKISEQLNPQWLNLINLMLNYNQLQRLSFKQLQKYFADIQPKLKKQILDKYGDTNIDVDDNNILLSINPYRSNPNHANQNGLKNGLNDVLKKLQQQRSFTNLNNLRKWFNFSRQKSQHMIKLIKQFNNVPYNDLKNVYKYILLFLSTSAYISKMTLYLNQLKNNKNLTPDGPISQQDIISKHKNQYKQILKQTSIKYSDSIKKYKGIIQNQVYQKIINTYMKRPQQKKIINSYGNLVNLLDLAKNSNYTDYNLYIGMFKSIANQQGIHYQQNKIEQLKHQNIKVYACIRSITCIDDVFLNTYFKNDDYISLKKQQLQNATRQQLIAFALKYNFVK